MSPTFVDEASVFQEPGAYSGMLERHRAGRTREQLLRAAGGQEMKDAWQACMFSLGYQQWRRVQTEVRICAPAQFPDFQLRVEGSTFDFEATMVVERGRRMGDEYRGNTTLGPAPIERPPGDLPAFDAAQLQEAIRLKAGRTYAARPHLLVYVNLHGRAGALAGLVSAAQIPQAAAFESIWVIGGKHFACVKTSDVLPAPGDWQRIPIV